MKYLIMFLLSFSCLAGENVKLNKAYLEVTKAVGTNRHWSIPENEEKAGEVSFYMEAIYFKHVYSRSYVNSFYTNRQFRYIALTEELAVKPFEDIEVFVNHTSEHALDYEYDNLDGKYPNSNAIGIRIHLLGD